MSTGIVKNRIEGTRITVWDVYHYLDHGWTKQQIAEFFKLPVEKIQAAIDFIDENREFVEEGHRKIEERIARGNPPEIEERLKETRKRMQAWLAERRRHQARETTATRP